MGRTAEEILKDRREADKRRFKRYKERQEAQGKRHISGMISAEAYDLLCRERDKTGDSTATIIEKALLGFYGKSVPVQEVKPEPVTFEEIPETLTGPLVEPEQEQQPDADTIIIQMRDAGKEYPDIEKYLNDKGLLTPKGRKWTKDNVRQRYYKLTK